MSPEEAAAIAAAIERFERDTAPVPAPPPAPPGPSAWTVAARREAVGAWDPLRRIPVR